MNDNTMNEQITEPSVAALDHDIAPDDLMNDFRGKSVAKIVIFTLIVHGIFIGLFSLGGLFDEELDEKEKLDRAVRDGTAALREIADRYKISPAELTQQFTRDAPKPAPAPDRADEQPAPTTGDGQPDGGTDPDPPLSDIEKKVREEVTGPTLPDLSADDEEGLFTPEPTTP